MKVVLKHEGVWLLIKEVYAIRRSATRRRSRQKRNVTPYGTVAESIDSPPINGYRFTSEIEVPATKVMRFIVKMFQAPGNAIIVVEPKTRESYTAKIYAKTRSEAEGAARLAEEIIAQLRTRRGAGETPTASDIEEVELEEEEAGGE